MITDSNLFRLNLDCWFENPWIAEFNIFTSHKVLYFSIIVHYN